MDEKQPDTKQTIPTVIYNKQSIVNIIELLNKIQITGLNQAQYLVAIFQLLNQPVKESEELNLTETN